MTEQNGDILCAIKIEVFSNASACSKLEGTYAVKITAPLQKYLEKNMVTLKPGDKAPAFTLKSDNGEKISLSTLKGKKIILYFYPKDNTPGCTTQACEYRDLQNDFKKSNVVVLGVSKDSLESHKKFRKDHKLNFPLLSDPDLNVHKAYGAFGNKMLYGKTFLGVIRTTVVINGKGNIVSIGKVKAKVNAAKSLEIVS